MFGWLRKKKAAKSRTKTIKESLPLKKEINGIMWSIGKHSRAAESLEHFGISDLPSYELDSFICQITQIEKIPKNVKAMDIHKALIAIFSAKKSIDGEYNVDADGAIKTIVHGLLIRCDDENSGKIRRSPKAFEFEYIPFAEAKVGLALITFYFGGLFSVKCVETGRVFYVNLNGKPKERKKIDFLV